MNRFAALALLPLTMLVGCGGPETESEPAATAAASDPAPAAAGHDAHDDHAKDVLPVPLAGATIAGTFLGRDGAQLGEMIIKDGPHGMLIRVDLRGLPYGFHGVHLHAVGDCSDAEAGFKASGPHFNPETKAHGLLAADGFERADLPNIFAHHDGHARAELFAYGVTLANAQDADGFAFVVHAKEDDHITPPIGNAGERIACAAFR